MDVHSVKLDTRTVVGKKVRALRREGLVPVHVYGSGIDPTPLQVDDRMLNRLLQSVGSNIPVSVEAEGLETENICFVREVQRHPVTEAVLHVDFLRVDVSQTISAEVPIVLDGPAPGITQLGGVLLQNLLSLLVEALPMEMLWPHQRCALVGLQRRAAPAWQHRPHRPRQLPALAGVGAAERAAIAP